MNSQFHFIAISISVSRLQLCLGKSKTYCYLEPISQNREVKTGHLKLHRCSEKKGARPAKTLLVQEDFGCA